MKKLQIKNLIKMLACTTATVVPLTPILPSVISNTTSLTKNNANDKQVKYLDVSSAEHETGNNSVLKSYNLLLGVEGISTSDQTGILLDSNSNENKLYVEIYETGNSDSIILAKIDTSKNKWSVKTSDGTLYNAFWTPVIKDADTTKVEYKQYDVLFNFAQVYSAQAENQVPHQFSFKFYMANSSKFVDKLTFTDSWSSSNGYTLLSNSLEFDKDIDDSLNAYTIHNIRLYPVAAVGSSNIDWSKIDKEWISKSVAVDYSEFSQNFCKYPGAGGLPIIDDNRDPSHSNIDLLNPVANPDGGYIQFDLRFDGDKNFVIKDLANLYFYFLLQNVPTVSGSTVDKIYANCNTNIHFADYFNFKWWYIGIPIISIVVIILVSLLIWYIVKSNRAPKRFNFSKVA